MSENVAAATSATPAANSPAPISAAALVTQPTQSTEQVAQPTDIWANMGLDPDVSALVKTKSYKNVNDLGKAYINAQKLIGSNKIALPGQDAKPEDWRAFYRQAGMPEKPDDYNFKKPEKGYYDDTSAQWLRKTAHDLGLSKKQAEALHDQYIGHVSAWEQAMKQQQAVESVNLMNGLKDEWGLAYDKNIEQAKRAVGKYIKGPEAANLLSQIEDAIGPVQLIKLFHGIGADLSEDSTEVVKSSFVKTPGDANAEIDRMYADPEFMKKFTDRNNPQHQWAKDEMAKLHMMAAGGR